MIDIISGIYQELSEIIPDVLYNHSMETSRRKTIKNSKRLTPYVVNITLNVLIFILLYGIRVLDVTNIDWITGNEGGGDITQHYLGWLAYRKSDWCFPPGMGMGLNGNDSYSILYTDSIPLFAFFFKLIRVILPEHFQYFGLYGFISYVLMGFFATRILNRYKVDDFCSAFFSIMISFNPIMLWRMFFHTALAGHWIILWAIDILLSHRNRGRSGAKRTVILIAILGFMTVFTMAYFLPICGLILLAYFIYETFRNKRILFCILCFCSYCASALFGMWLLGAFGGTSAGSAGLGLENYGFNLNCFYNPMKWGSLIMPPFPTVGIEQETEVYMYLGAGVLLMVLCAVILAIVKRREVKTSLDKAFFASVGIASVLSLVIAASPKVTFNDKVLFRYPVPKFIYNAWSIFRSIDRIAWVVFYLILILGCIAFFKLLPVRARSIAVAVVFAVQLLDISPLFMSIRYTLQADMATTSSLPADGVWEEISQGTYDEFVFFSCDYICDEVTIFPVTEYALEHDMRVNLFRFSRDGYFIGKKEAALEALTSHDASKIYVFTYDDLQDAEIVDAVSDSGISLYETSGFVVGLYE